MLPWGLYESLNKGTMEAKIKGWSRDKRGILSLGTKVNFSNAKTSTTVTLSQSTDIFLSGYKNHKADWN